MVETHDLTKQYEGRTAVKNLSIRIEQGEVYGFLGPNGAGKSTTIFMILGLVRPTRGNVKLFGQQVSDAAPELKANIGVVGEHQHFYPEMTTWEYLSFFGNLYRVRNMATCIDQVLARVGLTSAKRQPVGQFSKGMQQKLAVARALVHDPKLLVFDEPVSNLDPYGIRQIRDIILEEQAKGKTLLISSHLLSEVERTASRVAILDRGELIIEDTVCNLRRKLSSSIELHVELQAVSDDAEDQILSLPFVKSVDRQGTRFVVRTGTDRDHRGELSRFLTDKGCVVLGLTRKDMSLEEAFITITEENISLFANGVKD